jgi:hypothetical protein
MKIRIERRGGLVGKVAVGERELGELSPAQRKALDALVKAPPKPGPSPGADRFRYKVQLVDETGKREFDVPEDAMPDVLASIPEIKL